MAQRDKDRYQVTARIMKAVAQPVRLAILEALRDGERCVSEIVEAVGAERSNVSRHLSVLTNAGVVLSRKDGLQVFYRLETPCILTVFTCARRVIEAHLESNRRALCCM